MEANCTISYLVKPQMQQLQRIPHNQFQYLPDFNQLTPSVNASNALAR